MVKRHVGMAVLLFAMVFGLAACPPTFDGTTPLSFAAAGGPLVTVSWPAATETDEGQFVENYYLRINGGATLVVPGTDTSCVLTGLLGGTTYSIEVTARNNLGQDSSTYSGDLASAGRVVGTYNSPAGFNDPSPVRCVPPVDTDGDRLPNGVESGDGVYVGPGATGTSPFVADTDGDGIRDGDETLGTTAGLALPALGAKPTKKDLLAEFDWLDHPGEPPQCGPVSHRPTPAAIALVVDAYATAPVPNPDGTTGVNFIADYGQGGVFTGGNFIADADGVIADGVDGTDFTSYKAANFAANRSGYFRWVLNPHRYNTSSSSSGQAELLGDDMIVSLACSGSASNVANTIVHEMGHLLGLGHGGNVNTNYKPNYNSVMNYQFQFPGIDTNCDGVGDGVLSYSTGVRPPLDESALIETDGICNGVDQDWNKNSLIDPGPISAEINRDVTRATLTDFNDWANLNFGGLTDGDGAPVPHDHDHDSPLVTEQPVPPAFQAAP